MQTSTTPSETEVSVSHTLPGGANQPLLANPCRAETRILEHLEGPWMGPDPTSEDLTTARVRYGLLKEALGHKGTGIDRWLTTDSPKFRKSVAQDSGLKRLAGVTLLAARGAATVWQEQPASVREDLAAAMEVSEADVNDALASTVCPHATRSCTLGCVTMTSVNAERNTARETRLARTLLTLLRPAEAFELTYHQLRALTLKHGDDGVRWRINIADDLRYEHLAPGLLTAGPKGYAYTKHRPRQRAEVPGVRLVYSISEHWQDNEVEEVCAAGHSVAMVFNLKRSEPLPATWHGIRVVDGDVTDDLWSHPEQVIVGLRLKGRRRAVRQQLIESGFARTV